MPFQFDFQEQPADRDLLRSFFQQLEEFLKGMCFEPQQYLRPVPYIEGWQGILQPIWEQAQPEFGRAQATIGDVQTSRLAQAGLTGGSLRGKLAVVAHWAARLGALPGVGVLRRLLSAINTLLGSFVQATGVGELIKELKETVENVIDDLGR